MNKLSVSTIVYAELPSEARTLLFILGMGATLRYGIQPPKRSELTPLLESVWNGNWLRLEDVADPFRMTNMLKAHFTANPASWTPKAHNDQDGFSQTERRDRGGDRQDSLRRIQH